MFGKLKKWLFKPYPFPIKFKSKLSISISIGLFVFFFLSIFKPFDYYKLKNNEVLQFSLRYGFNSASIILLNLTLLPLFFKSAFNTYKWNIGKMIIFILVNVSLIGILNWIILDFSSFNYKGSKYDFIFFQFTSYLVGIFPLLIYIYITERIIYKNRLKVINNINSSQKQNKNLVESSFISNDKEIIIKGENKDEKIALNINELLYINSEKNYASVFCIKNGKIKEILLRTSLNKIEKQLTEFNSIVRCHKSYIVNTKKVIKIDGNARGYFLKIDNVYHLIPVSRSFPKELLFTLVNQ